MEFPPRVSLARLPTPLQPLDRISEALPTRHRIWVKRDDLTDTAVSGNKLRKLEFVAAAAREQGCDTLITCGGVQSNHCRATALVGAQLGFKVHLILRGEAPDPPDGNLLLGHLAGATISHYPPREYVAELPALFEQWRQHYAAHGRRALCIPTGASDGIGLWGYIAGAEELLTDMAGCGIRRADWVCATGSGGTQAGLTLGAAMAAAAVQVWGVNVCDDEAWFMRKVGEDITDAARRYPQLNPLPAFRARVIDGYVGPGYGQADAEVFELIARLARLEGLVLDPVYTGKAFLGLLTEIERGRFGEEGDIIFVHTGGIFGVFPQRDQFRLPAAAGDA